MVFKTTALDHYATPPNVELILTKRARFVYAAWYNLLIMANAAQTIVWEAAEHHHIEKGSDWYWALGIVAAVGAIIAVIFSNILFAVVIALGAVVMALVSRREPRMLAVEITPRGVRVDEKLHPYATLESFCIDEESPHGPQLLLKSRGLFQQLIVVALPPESVEEIDDILAERLPEEHLQDSISQHVLEFLGF